MACGWLAPSIHVATLVCDSEDSGLVRRHLHRCGGGVVTNRSRTVALDKWVDYWTTDDGVAVLDTSTG